MNEWLDWTGNGHYNGTGIGGGTINIYCYVIDVQKALNATLEERKNNHLLDGVKIVFKNKRGDYIVLFAEGAEFDLI